MQQVFVHLLTTFDFKLPDPKADVTFTYTTIVFPRPGLKILLRERADNSETSTVGKESMTRRHYIENGL